MLGEKLTVLDGRTYVKANNPILGTPAWRTLANGLTRVHRGEMPLFTIALAVTSRCAMNCIYCSEKVFPRGDELSAKRLIELIGEAQDLGIFAVNFTGGEPLLREDLPELVAAVDDRSLTLTTTSGFHVPKRCGALREAGLDYLGVSLDTFDRAELARRRGHPDALQLAIDAARAALHEGLYTSLLAVPDETMLRLPVFDAYVKAARRLGVHECRFQGPRPCVATGREHSRVFTDAQLRRLYRLQVHYNGMRDMPTVTSIDYSESAENQGCYGGTFYCYVSSTGEVAPCAHFPVTFGNVAERPLGEIIAHMRRVIPRPPLGCPLLDFYRLIRDVPEHELPLRDPARIEDVFGALLGDHPPLPRFWQELGM